LEIHKARRLSLAGQFQSALSYADDVGQALARHSTVWDGGDLIFDFNFQAFGVDPNECFYHACHKELPPGKYRRVYLAEHYTVEQSRETAYQTSGIAEPLEKTLSVGLSMTGHSQTSGE
jgi:hypothetical protein